MKPDEGKNIHKEAQDEIEGKMKSGLTLKTKVCESISIITFTASVKLHKLLLFLTRTIMVKLR